MKIFSFILLIVFILIVGVLRLNLPSNHITEQIAVNKESNLFEQVMVNVMMSDTVADWRYIDLVVVKYACSERLDVTLIGLPFRRWQEASTDVDICEVF